MNVFAEFDNGVKQAALDAARQVLTAGRSVTLSAGGLSMGTGWGDVEAVTIAPVPKRITRGMVVVFARDGLWVAHRVIGFVRIAGIHHLLTKGDGVRRVDQPPVRTDEPMGIVASIWRCGRAISLRTPGARLRHWCRAIVELFLSALARLMMN